MRRMKERLKNIKRKEGRKSTKARRLP